MSEVLVPDMDMLHRVSLGIVIGVMILPAWAVLRLPSLKVSMPIGTFIHWGWLVLGSDFLREFDPGYDSLAPAFNIVFGWGTGLIYCAIWAGIRRWLLHSRVDHTGSSTGVVVWSCLVVLCLCFPFMTATMYHRNLAFYMPYTLIGVAPVLLLCSAMVFTHHRGIRK